MIPQLNRGTMTLIAVEKYLNNQSKSIVDTMDLPVDISEYDKDVFLSKLIRTYGRLPITYNDPDWFYDECEYWFKSHKFAYTKMWEALELEYNPIENYDRHEYEKTNPGITETETHSGSDSQTHGGVDSTSITGTETNAKTGHDDLERQGKLISDTDTLAKSREIAENKVSAFNESNYQPSTKSEVHKEYDINGTDVPDNVHSEVSHQNDKDVNTYNSTDTLTHNTTNALTHGETITDQHGHVVTKSKTGYDERELDVHGNIGVMSSQQMLIAEEELRHKIDLYKVMSIDFACEMLVRVW